MEISEQSTDDAASPSQGHEQPSDQSPLSSGQADDTVPVQRQLDEAKQDQKDAHRAVNFLFSILNQLPVGLTVQSEDGRALFINEMAAEYTGSLSASRDAAPAAPGAPGGDKPAASAPSSAAAIIENRVAGAAGERTLLECRRSARVLDQPVLISTALDFTERKQAEIELSKRAYFDDLTGLPNRTLIQEHVEHLLTQTQAPSRFALAFIDIDNFKHINDYYTHAIGDALLVKVAERVAGHIRPSDVFGRISGDEFLLVLNPLGEDDDLAILVDNLLQQLKEPFLIEGFEVFTSASIGVSMHPDHGLNYEMLRRAADTAMYRVKEGAKGGAALFNADMGRAMTSRMAQEQRLRLAVRDGLFCCAFQPKVDIRTEEVVGVEALIRLRDEDGVIQAPGEFIGLAVDLGLIDDLTYLALGQIVKSMDMLDEAFGPGTPISINVAAKQAGDPKFMSAFCDELGATNCASRFMVEVTEDAFLAKSQFQFHVLPMLREVGARVSIDDFGTGYSSLAALADITADEIKIDRSFIVDIHKRTRNQSVLKAIEALCEALGVTVIAEGVETFEEVAYLQAATRIRYAQGYYFAKPIFLEELGRSSRDLGVSRAASTPRERHHPRGQRATSR
jgi:c-di-GMP phosphodiesterase Gmr